MRFSLNLVARSIILTAILVLSQFAFILVLSDVLRVSQEKIEKQWRSENMIRLTFSLGRAFSELLVFSHVPTNLREVSGVDGPASLARAKRDTKLLYTLASEDPLKRDAVRKMLSADAVLIQAMQTALEGHDPDSNWPLSFAVPLRFRKLLQINSQAFFDSVDEIVAIEKKEHSADHSGAATLSALTTTLVFAVIASIAIAIVLGFAYAVSIRRPLKHLSDNARLLSAQKSLLPQLAQRDEFGRLDAMLHATSREVEKTLMQERETIENAADLICALDDSGNFMSVNPFAEKILGLAPDKFIGINVHDLTVAEESLLADEHVRKSVLSPEMQQFELKLRHADGGVIDTRWSCLWSPAERKLFCVVRDVTEEIEIELLKQDFANMISHDLRSPLMAMANSLTLLKAGAKGELPEDARKRIEMSGRNVEKLIVLVNDLLDFQKLKAGKMELVLEPVSLEAIIKDAVDLVDEAAHEKNVEIVVPVGETIVRCDRIKLLQAAVNLISNAIKFSGSGGEVAVSVQSKEKTVLISVSDTGPGVPADFQQRIFEPFEQAPSGRKNEGTGLGLAICRLVVEAHGGTVKAENRADIAGQVPASESKTQGSIFTVELPLNADQDAEAIA